jgi:hypothetical protein
VDDAVENNHPSRNETHHAKNFPPAVHLVHQLANVGKTSVLGNERNPNRQGTKQHHLVKNPESVNQKLMTKPHHRLKTSWL